MNKPIYSFLLGLVAIGIFSCNSNEEPMAPLAKELTIKGLDISFFPQAQQYGAVFYDLTGNQIDVLETISQKGINYIRLKIWHTPATTHASLQEVAQFAQQVHQAGMKVWLTVHYSDSWADPAKQQIPKAWEGKPFDAVKDSVYAYTQSLMREIKPEIIQIGNEINSGILFPHGNISQQKEQFIALLQAGSQAVRDLNTDTQIMLHYAGIQNSDWFFAQLNEQVAYDLIGISYYPKWHGKSLTALQEALQSLSVKYNKPTLIAETAYPFTLQWADYTNNIIGDNSQILFPEYPATAVGQKAYLDAMVELLENTPNAIGLCYWGATWTAFKGPQSREGSTWENQALFDFNHRLLPAIEAFQ